jgi:tRNA1(Val) A37 N6-methylase TrmN6
MVEFARRTIAHPANSRIHGRVEILEADVTLTGKARSAAGLGDDTFQFALMNPPFNAPVDRASPDALRRAAHVMDAALFERWLRTAAAIVRPRGGVAVIARPQSLREILAAMEGRFGNAQIVPIQPRPSEAAIRIVVRAVRASRAPLSLMPALIMHDAGGNRFSERANSVNNGHTSLFGD